MTPPIDQHFHIWLLHQERWIRQLEVDPYYPRLPECYPHRTQVVRVPGGRGGIIVKCEEAHTLDLRRGRRFSPGSKVESNHRPGATTSTASSRSSPTIPSINKQERQYDHPRRSVPG